MEVLLINGSPHPKGCTWRALSEVASAIEANGVKTRMIKVPSVSGAKGCIACGKCLESGHCAFGDDGVNEAIDLLKSADGLIVGAPVHYAGPAAALTGFLDRMFFGKAQAYAHKPAAAIVSCRRGGASAAFDRLNKYFTISSMPIVASSYWNEVHGSCAEDVEQDLEGLQTMRNLGANMAWLVKAIDLAGKNGLPRPTLEEKIFTNFIR